MTTLSDNIYILYINLEIRNDRNIHVLNELKKVKNKIVNKITGVYLTDINQDDYKKYYENRLSKECGFIDDDNNLFKKGIIGCYISHIKCIEYIINNYSNIKNDYVVVIEDDIIINTNKLQEEIENNLNLIPDDWDLVRIDTWDNTRKNDMINDNIYKVSLPSFENNKYFYHGAHMIIYNKHKINKILKEVRRPKHGICDFDGLLCKSSLNQYVINKKLTLINNNCGSNT
jgi:GR25 family glycosyltransferase involved in LPS biosynthesis|tara:strand:- start:658 stop:1347 length:690 start_codon:yes stop_codon:yes gene_type:complete